MGENSKNMHGTSTHGTGRKGSSTRQHVNAKNWLYPQGAERRRFWAESWRQLVIPGKCGFQSCEVELGALWWAQGSSKQSQYKDRGEAVQGQRCTCHREDTPSSECEGQSSVFQSYLESSSDHNEMYFSNWVIGRVNPIPRHTSDKIETVPACSRGCFENRYEF